MSITAKPTGYTVNTAHAKCPDHLWMMDGSDVGTTVLTDIGKIGGLDITLANADMWGTDTGDLGSDIVNFNSTTSRYARLTGYTPPSSSALWIAIAKPSSATIGAASEVLTGVWPYRIQCNDRVRHCSVRLRNERKRKPSWRIRPIRNVLGDDCWHGARKRRRHSDH